MDNKISPKEIIVVFLILALVGVLFFYKTFLMGLVPFPGDLLISEYNPWKTYSYLGYLPGSFPNKAQYFDVIRQLYPWKTLSIDLLKTGEIPLWNPYNFSGTPLLANFQSAVFSPLNILYLLFSQITAWTILTILQPLLASFFTYLFARKIGIGRIGSFLASFAFAYSLFMSVFLEYNTIGHVLAWLPLSLYLVEKLLEKITFWRLILFTMSVVISLLAGHLQIFGFSFIFIFIYILCRINSSAWSVNKKLAFLVIFTSLLILSLGISSIQLSPTFELFESSARINQSYQFLVDKLLIQPYQAILFLSPDFFGNPATRNYLIPDTYPGNAIYIGLIPFIFALFTLTNFKKNNLVSFFLLTSLILFLFFLRTPFTEIFYRFQIPLFSTGSPTNAIFLLTFVLSILSGFGIEQYLTKSQKFYRLILAVGGLFGIVWLIILISPPQIVSVRNFLYSTGILVIFVLLFLVGNILNNKKRIIGFLFLMVTIFDLFYFFQKFNPFTPQELVFPNAPIFNYLKERAGIDRFWGYGSAAIEANFATQYLLLSPDGYDPLYPKRYGEFIQSSKNGRIETQFSGQTRSDAVLAPGFGEEDLPSNFYRLRIADLLGVKYFLDRTENGTTEKTFPTSRFKLINEQDGWRIFENLKATPRAFLTSDYKTFTTKEEFEGMFFDSEFNPARTVLLNESVNNLDNQKDRQEEDKLRVISYTPNKIVFESETRGRRLLFLSDTYYPGWKAFLDGRETKIYRANYAFRAVLVPAGNHTVIFRYQPESFSLGLKTTIISFVLLGSFIFIKKL